MRFQVHAVQEIFSLVLALDATLSQNPMVKFGSRDSGQGLKYALKMAKLNPLTKY